MIISKVETNHFVTVAFQSKCPFITNCYRFFLHLWWHAKMKMLIFIACNQKICNKFKNATQVFFFSLFFPVTTRSNKWWIACKFPISEKCGCVAGSEFFFKNLFDCYDYEKFRFRLRWVSKCTEYDDLMRQIFIFIGCKQASGCSGLPKPQKMHWIRRKTTVLNKLKENSTQNSKTPAKWLWKNPSHAWFTAPYRYLKPCHSVGLCIVRHVLVPLKRTLAWKRQIRYIEAKTRTLIVLCI